MNKVRKKGKLVYQFSTNEFAELMGQTAQNIRYKALKNRFKTELTGISAISLSNEYLIEMEVKKNIEYLTVKNYKKYEWLIKKILEIN